MTPCPATLNGGPLRCQEDASTDHEHYYVSTGGGYDAEDGRDGHE